MCDNSITLIFNIAFGRKFDHLPRVLSLISFNKYFLCPFPMRLFILFTYVTHTFTYVKFSMFYNIGDKTEKCLS